MNHPLLTIKTNSDSRASPLSISVSELDSVLCNKCMEKKNSNTSLLSLWLHCLHFNPGKNPSLPFKMAVFFSFWLLCKHVLSSQCWYHGNFSSCYAAQCNHLHFLSGYTDRLLPLSLHKKQQQLQREHPIPANLFMYTFII